MTGEGLRLLLVRHGETAANLRGQIQGQSEIPLTDNGRDQARRLAVRLSAEPLSAVLASPLVRARETAEIVARPHGLQPRLDPRLKEFGFGTWEGLTWPQVRRRSAPQWQAWARDREQPPPGGEPLSAVRARVQQLLDQLTTEREGQTLLLVAHGGSLRVLICLAFGIDLALEGNLALHNSSLSELLVRPRGAVLQRLNDTAHLSG